MEETQANATQTDQKPTSELLTRLEPLLFGLALLFFLCFVSFILRLPLRKLVAIVPDDAFYYLQIARHIAQTGFSSADGLHPTNGYHPAWMACMVVCARFVANRETLLRVCVALSLSLHLVTSLLFVGIARRFVAPLWAWVGGASWLLNPFAVTLALQGMETSLSLCALLIVVGVYLQRIAPHLRRDAPFHPPAADLARFGLSLGFAFLARTEAVLLIGVTLLLLGAAIRFLTPTRPVLPAYLRASLLISVPILLCALPWFLYSWHVVGSWQQDSGAMKMLWTAHYLAPRGGIGRLRAWWDFLLWSWVETPLLYTFSSQSTLLIAEIELAAVALVAVYFGWKSRPPATFLPLNLWLLLTLFISTSFYGLFLLSNPIWYAAEPTLILFLLLFVWLARALMRADWAQGAQSQGVTGAIFLSIWLFLFGHLLLNPPNLYPWQADVYDSQPKFEAQIPPDAHIGCFNSGIPAYFSPRVVVNLDGLVNHSVASYYRQNRFDRYLYDAHIAYIADEIDAETRAAAFSPGPLPLQPLAQAPLTGWLHPTRWLWRVEPSH